jgi:pimeloyl-ACP methyl ester carboxylesterase
MSTMTHAPTLKHIRTPVLDIAYEEAGPPGGAPVFLMHGWPYDVRVYDEVAAILAAAGCRTIAPHLRGFGPTQFLSAATPRSGQQAALGRDLVELMDALAIPKAGLVGYDWGGRAACVVTAVWPERVLGLVTGGGYNIQDIAASLRPAPPEQEHRFWYQYYFQTERGRAGLEADRRALIRYIWRLWSPNWPFDDATFARSAASFDNPDFVAVTIQSYRHRFAPPVPGGEGDPAYDEIERRLAAKPPITVPAITLHGEGNGVSPPAASAGHARFFTGPYQRRVVPRAGHNLPAEAPKEVAAAALEVAGLA